jgi:hypothetical protein
MLWRLLAERKSKLSHEQIEAIEHRASKWIAASLFILSSYVALDAVESLWQQEKPGFSWVGVSLTSVSIWAAAPWRQTPFRPQPAGGYRLRP